MHWKSSESLQENSILSFNHRPYHNTYTKEKIPAFPGFLTLEKHKSKIFRKTQIQDIHFHNKISYTVIQPISRPSSMCVTRFRAHTSVHITGSIIKVIFCTEIVWWNCLVFRFINRFNIHTLPSMWKFCIHFQEHTDMVRLLSFPLLLPAPAPSQPLDFIFVMTFSLYFSYLLLYLASSLYQPQDLRYQDYMERDYKYNSSS